MKKMTKAQQEHWDNRPKIKKLDQKVIDAYEGFIPQVYEAIRFVKMGSGKKCEGSFDLLVRIVAEHEREMWKNLEKAIFPKTN